MFNAAMLDEFGYVYNIIVVDNLGFLPNLVDAGTTGMIGDYWNLDRFVHPDDPDFPLHP